MDQNLLPMTRQQRRNMERQIKKIEKRKTFTIDEVHAMNAQAFELGKETALDATKEVLGLGPVRLDRIKYKIADLEIQRFAGFAPVEPDKPGASRKG